MRADYPIILAHGICRFDQLLNITFGLDNQPEDRFHYFRRIRSTLMAEGFMVFHSQVAWAADVATRARDLKEQVEFYTRNFSLSDKVHIIAHSMGGLDARHMIFRYQMEHRVASLTTIGTPHWGSHFADWGMGKHGRVIAFLDRLGFNARGFADLTSAACVAFNARAASFEQSNGVRYQTYAGAQPRNRVFRPLRFSHRIIDKAAGANDGLVAVNSARWHDGVFVKVFDADHLNEIGWCDSSEPEFHSDREGFEQRIRQIYLEIALGL